MGLLHTAAATGAEQRAASATPSHKRDRAMPGRTGPSTRSAQPSAAALYPTSAWSEVGFPTSLFQAFCALFGPKESGDKAVTSRDMLGGLEFAAFPARKRKTEQSGRLEPAFHRKPANLEARASHLQSDTKNGLFGLDRFERFFAPKNGAGWSGDFSGDKLGGLTDSGDEAVTSRRDRFWAKKRRFGQVARAHGEMV